MITSNGDAPCAAVLNFGCTVSDITAEPGQSKVYTAELECRRHGHVDIEVNITPVSSESAHVLTPAKSSTVTKPSQIPATLHLSPSDMLSIDAKKVLLKKQYLLTFSDAQSLDEFMTLSKSVFNARTTATSAEQYFQFYSLISQQQNMMQDFVRTGTYQQAMLQNAETFQNKVVLDCGAGSSILSFFAIQAGADKVYACEASSIAKYAAKLVDHSPYKGRIIVVSGKIEEIELPEKVDILISEPMGYMLYNERMIESYVHAKKFLRNNKNDGTCLMFPSVGDLYCAPFSDEAIYLEQHQKASFWCVNSFYGIDLTSLREDAIDEYFSQPIVDQINADTLVCQAIRHRMDYRVVDESAFERIEIPFNYVLTSTNLIHGFAFWFDVCFCGQQKDVWLSTAPTEALTHWYQVRCVLKQPLFGRTGEHLQGSILLVANERQSYDIDITARILETGVTSHHTYDLKNPFFRYNGSAPPTVPGTNTESPSNQLFNGVQITASPASGNGTKELLQNPNATPCVDPVTYDHLAMNGLDGTWRTAGSGITRINEQMQEIVAMVRSEND